jgi:hypothetical protein
MMQLSARRRGGIALVTLLFKETEAVPLICHQEAHYHGGGAAQTLKAPFSGGKTVIAGANLRYTPIDIGKQATSVSQTSAAGSGDNNFTFGALAHGPPDVRGW